MTSSRLLKTALLFVCVGGLCALVPNHKSFCCLGRRESVDPNSKNFCGWVPEKPFVLVVVAQDFTEHSASCLESLLTQRYDPYRVIYVADGWPEEKIHAFEQRISARSKVTFFKNREPRGHLACLCQAVFSCRPEEIVVEVAEETRWCGAFILTQLDRWYRDLNFWMTCGPSGKSIRSFYAGLFHKIHKKDFLENGNFVSENAPMYYLLPMLQMAQNRAYRVSENGVDVEFLVCEEKALEPLRGEYAPLEDPPFSPKPFLPPQDYYALQKELLEGERKNLERLGDMFSVVRNMRVIGDSSLEIPLSGTVAVNCKEEDRECCVLVYATFNRNYPRGLRRLVEWIVNSDFEGHVLYRLGGWPDIEGGSLSLAHVPYGFKPAFFREAQRMGFKRVLWLDVAVVPLVSLNLIFEMIRDKGYFVMGNAPHRVGPFMHPLAAVYFGLTLEQAGKIPSCSAGLFGIDFTRSFAHQLFEDWYRAALDEDAFFSPRSDQNALSILLNRYGLEDLTDIRRMPHSETGDPIHEDALFYLDRGFVR